MQRSSFVRAACAFARARLLRSSRPGERRKQPALDAALDAIAAYAPRAMHEQGTPGLSVAITDRTQTLRIITLGYANRETPNARHAADSLRDRLDHQVDDGACAAATPRRRTARLERAGAALSAVVLDRKRKSPRCSCTSCFRIPADFPTIFPPRSATEYDIVALRRARTIFPPGTAWSYSNDGYATLGAILAQLDGRAWSDSLQARVFAPIGMTESSPVFTPETDGGRCDRVSVPR